jgi:hypothetical protein
LGNFEIKLDGSLSADLNNIALEISASSRITLHGRVLQNHEAVEPLLCQTPDTINENTPLLHIKLTLATEEAKTAIGVSWHHVLGNVTHFISILNHFAQRGRAGFYR